MDITKPGILIVSSSNTKPKSLIKLITKQTNLSEESSDSNVISHSWQIDTKYYTANVIVHGLINDYKTSDDFNNTIEALLIHMDSNKETGLQDIEKWKIIEEECDPDVKILLCNYCSNDTKITKVKATEWCVKRGFELIELYPQDIPVKENEVEDEIIKEKFGIDRIIEVLHAHVWSNLIMKDKDKKEIDNKSGLKESDHSSCDGPDDFTELFTQLQMMKESIQSMPLQERKQCAEQMVTAFWRAIGGDEDEVADI